MTEPRWKARGRTAAQLIDELAAFGNPQLEVRTFSTEYTAPATG